MNDTRLKRQHISFACRMFKSASAFVDLTGGAINVACHHFV
jgi:hypothetical protein